MAALGIPLSQLSDSKSKMVSDMIKKINQLLYRNYPRMGSNDINDLTETITKLSLSGRYNIINGNIDIISAALYYIYLSRRRPDLPQPAYASIELLNSSEMSAIIANIVSSTGEKSKKQTSSYYKAELLRFAQLIDDFILNSVDDGLFDPIY